MLGTLFAAMAGGPAVPWVIAAAGLSVFYVDRGGLRTVILTDQMQFVLMYGGFILLLGFLFLRHGGIGFLAPRVPASHAEKMLVRVQYGPLASLARGVAKTADISIFSLKMLGKMLLGEVSWRHLSGPVTIADFAGQSAQMGWISYLSFLALISISLGVLNLLPIPLLDG